MDVRKGTLDYVLLLPVDAPFMVSTTRFYLWRSVNALTALVIFGAAFVELGRRPALTDVLVAAALFAAAAAVLHAVWTLAMCTVFFAVKTDHITDVLSATLDAARWPSSVFRGTTRVVLTFVVPLGLMTTVPARALLGHLDGTMAAVATGEAVLLSALACLFWRHALAHYTSASS